MITYITRTMPPLIQNQSLSMFRLSEKSDVLIQKGTGVLGALSESLMIWHEVRIITVGARSERIGGIGDGVHESREEKNA